VKAEHSKVNWRRLSAPQCTSASQDDPQAATKNDHIDTAGKCNKFLSVIFIKHAKFA